MSVSRAKRLRANSTEAERTLWLKLRDRCLLGAEFRRQVSFPPYTVDFCCFEAKLIVEVDGGQHAVQVKRDAVRTARLEHEGFSVIRFWDDDVLSNINGVLESLMIELQARGAPFEPLPPETPNSNPGERSGPRRSVMAARIHTAVALAGKRQPARASHIHHLRVYFEDTDAGGMVYYANYLKFAERARTEMLRAAGISHAAMVADDGLMLVVRRVAAEYRRSARLDDELVIATTLVECAGASLTLDQVIRRGGEVLVELTVTIACITREGRPTRLPERLRHAVEAGRTP